MGWLWQQIDTGSSGVVSASLELDVMNQVWITYLTGYGDVMIARTISQVFLPLINL